MLLSVLLNDMPSFLQKIPDNKELGTYYTGMSKLWNQLHPYKSLLLSFGIDIQMIELIMHDLTIISPKVQEFA